MLPLQALHALYDDEFSRTIEQLKNLCESCDEHGTDVLPQADLMLCISSLDRGGGLAKIESKLLLSVLPRDPQGNVIYDMIGAALEQVCCVAFDCNTLVATAFLPFFCARRWRESRPMPPQE